MISSSSPGPSSAILQRMLRELHVTWAPVDASPALGLARITGLAGVDAAVSALLDDPRIAPDLAPPSGRPRKALPASAAGESPTWPC